MQNEVKNVMTDLATWSGLSGPIPNVGQLRRSREQARLAALNRLALGRPENGAAPIAPLQAPMGR